MATESTHDRGCGPEIVGSRITVFNLLVDFMDARMTEARICRLYDLTPERVASARAYILNNPDTVLARHLEIEARNAAGNSPELVERMKRTHVVFEQFREWLEKRRAEEAEENRDQGGSAAGNLIPTFYEWLAEQESRPVEGP
jgi:uncharacterized protein (DUF433 family)